MSETSKMPKNSKNDIEYCLRSFSPKNGKVKMYKKLASKLSKLVRKSPQWTWRYVQSAHHGTVEPSTKFLLAVDRYLYPKPKPKIQKWERHIKKKIAKMHSETKRELAEHGIH